MKLIHSCAVFSVFMLTACGGSSSGESSESSSSSYDLTVALSTTPLLETQLQYAKFAFSAPDAQTYECRLDANDFSDCESGLFLVDLGLGNHRFEVRAIASNGEIGSETSFDWNVNSLFDSSNDDLIATNIMPEPVAPNSWRGIIRINCDFAHSSYNDPIVYPDQENAAHLHRFYGNTLVDHTTTMESLYTTGESSCQGNQLNLSSYWVPALLAPLYDPITGQRELDNQGEPAWQVVPAVVGNDEEAHEIFYYSAGVDDLNSIQPVPAGLRMIAGNHATMPGDSQDTSIVRWHCQSWESDDATNPQFSATIPECLAPDRVRMDIFFPSCWNGEDLDSADHKSHMAYPIEHPPTGRMVCPDTHPVAVARPSYHYAFGVKPEVYDPVTQTSKGWRLAADMYEVTDTNHGGLSLHADWFNGWHPEIMQLIVDSCIKQALDCHDGNLANGYRLSGTRPGTQIEPDIINQGKGY